MKPLPPKKLAKIEADFKSLPLPTKWHYDSLSMHLGYIETEKAMGFKCPFSDGQKRLGLLWFPKSRMRIGEDGSLHVQTDMLNEAHRKRPELFFPEIAPGYRLLSA